MDLYCILPRSHRLPHGLPKSYFSCIRKPPHALKRPRCDALEAGPLAHMVAAEGRAARWPHRTHRSRRSEVARHHRVPRSFIAEHAQMNKSACGSVYDVCDCTREKLVVSTAKRFAEHFNTFVNTRPLQNAHTHIDNMIVNDHMRVRHTGTPEFAHIGHSGRATAHATHAQAHLKAHVRIAPPRASWRPPQRSPTRKADAARRPVDWRAADALSTRTHAAAAAARGWRRPAACTPQAPKGSTLSTWGASARPT